MCVSGSLIASRIVRSSSVSSPSMRIDARLPHARVRSRTTRGNLLHTPLMGCMRVFITPSCRSVVMRFRRCVVAFSSVRDSLAACWRIWLRASTSSPTRFISVSSTPTSTRIEVSAGARVAGSSPGGLGAVATLGAAPAARGVGPLSCSCCSSSSTAPAGSAGLASSTGSGSLASTGAAGGATSLGSSSEVNRSTSSGYDCSPSARVDSMRPRISRSASTVRSSALARASSSCSTPSRSLLSRFSAACATDSNRENARKPAVPLMVWKVRKIADSTSTLPGALSSCSSC